MVSSSLVSAIQWKHLPHNHSVSTQTCAIVCCITSFGDMLDHIVIWLHDWKCITAFTKGWAVQTFFCTKPNIWTDTHAHTDMVITIIGGSCHKYHFCGNKRSVMTNMSVVTNMFLSWQNMSFVTTKVCSSQQNFCRDKIMFVATNICHDKHVFVTTKVLSWQAYFCHNKRHVLSWQNYICCYNILSYFVATKITLVAAPANDKYPPHPQPPFVTGGIKSGRLTCTQQANTDSVLTRLAISVLSPSSSLTLVRFRS